VSSPVKAHLTDGSTLVFAEGVTVAEGKVTGDGRKYDVTLATSAGVSSIALDDMAAMESYQTPVKADRTAAVRWGPGSISLNKRDDRKASLPALNCAVVSRRVGASKESCSRSENTGCFSMPGRPVRMAQRCKTPISIS
jgi:hypothetical protein